MGKTEPARTKLGVAESCGVSEKAKSFLMDTIVRGKPIPKVLIRQTLNVTTKTSVRDVVDGQQRLRTILSFIKDEFSISRVQNKEFGGKRFSELPEDVRAAILTYKISVDLLINMPDEEVLDILSRLNSHAIIRCQIPLPKDRGLSLAVILHCLHRLM